MEILGTKYELIKNDHGLSDYSNNEELVDWLAMQFPKMFKVFQELGCTE